MTINISLDNKALRRMVMGLSASQARFLQLTARRSNIEYEAQQINFERLQWADKLAAASTKYNEATTNRQLTFSFNNGEEVKEVPLSYTNYKNYMNHQMEGLSTTQNKYYLVSSSGNKIVVGSEEERDNMIKTQPVKKLEDGTEVRFAESDFLIVEDLDNVSNFQKAIQDGVYFFAQLKENDETGNMEFKTESWETLGAGAITEIYDKTDDAAAEAEYQAMQDKVHAIDKKLEMRLDQLESQRSAIQTEIESVSKVIEDNIEQSFKTFG